MASTTVVGTLTSGENNNHEKVVTCSHSPEQKSPTESAGVAKDATNNTAQCTGLENPVAALPESSAVELKTVPAECTSLKLGLTVQESKTITEDSKSTSLESEPTRLESRLPPQGSVTTDDMGNSSEKNKSSVNLELTAKVSDQNEQVNKATGSSVCDAQQSSCEQSDNLSQNVQPTSVNQKGQNVKFVTCENGLGTVEAGCGPVSDNPGERDGHSAERPFVSTLGSQPDRSSQIVASATNGDLEEDGFTLRKHHGRSYSERGSGMLRGRVIVNGADDGTELEVRRRSGSVLEVKEQAYTRLKEELHSAQLELQLKDKECEKLSRIQSQMEKELEELTASLFEEANNMVQEANIKRMHTEKLLRESNSKIEVLQAEVSALKTLVITSTPSMPNRHLHPQIDTKPSKSSEKFVKSHKRSTSHHDFKKEMDTLQVITIDPDIDTSQKNEENREIDPVYYQEFKTWKTHPGLDGSHAFLQRIIHEDILPCLNFANQELSQDVFDSVRNNVLTIELIPGKNSFPRRCALLDTTKLCQYRIRLRDTGPWHFISQFARNRIATVCDFYTYMRYIQQGLVKSDESSIYWEIIRLRKQMAMARLGVMS